MAGIGQRPGFRPVVRHETPIFALFVSMNAFRKGLLSVIDCRRWAARTAMTLPRLRALGNRSCACCSIQIQHTVFIILAVRASYMVSLILESHSLSAMASPARLPPQVMPAWLTTVLLAALLTLLSYKLSVRGVATFKQESKDIAAVQHDTQVLQGLG